MSLPTPPTALIGRETETGALITLLRSPGVRVVTLTGPGGTGKTRLSLEVAWRIHDQFEGGAHFVPLAPVSEPELVLPAIAQAVGLKGSGGRPDIDRLAELFGDRRALLVLDNFEQIVAAAPHVAELLARAPGVSIITSSRIVLHIKGEHEVPLAPLALPDLQRLPSPEDMLRFGSIALFVERARSVNPSFALTPENAGPVAEICARLDGLPLALELAAARVKVLPPATMLARLSSSSRLRLLTGGPRDAPARQQTLRDAIGWSYDLLDETERALFADIGVFAGGFSLEAAEAVAAPPEGGDREVIDVLGSLLDKSLLRRDEAQEGGEPRFLMLETIREYSVERLQDRPGGAAALRERHAAYYRDMAERARGQLFGAGQVGELERLEREHDNFRAALAWALSSGAGETAVRVAGALGPFWWMHSHLREGQRWLSEALAASTNKDTFRAAAQQGLGRILYYSGDYKGAQAALDEALAIRRSLGDRAGESRTLDLLGAVALQQRRYQRARGFYEESLAIGRSLGDGERIASALGSLGLLSLYEGDQSAAMSYYEECLSHRRRMKDTAGIASALVNMGHVAYRKGEHARARGLFQESLRLYNELGNKAFIAECLEGLSAVAAVFDEPTRAAKLWGAAQALVAVTGAVTDPVMRPKYERALDVSRTSGVREAFADALGEGERMGVDRAVEEALVGSAPPSARPPSSARRA